LALLPNGLQKAVDRFILLRCRFIEVLRVATGDSSIKAPQRRTIMTKIHELYEAEKKKKEKHLGATKHVALTGDHWTSVSNDNYLGVTAHLITNEWKLKSFTLTCMKTEERHFAEACAKQFLTVASNWAIEDKTTTRAFRGIRLCHGVVNGCLTKKEKHFQPSYKNNG